MPSSASSFTNVDLADFSTILHAQSTAQSPAQLSTVVNLADFSTDLHVPLTVLLPAIVCKPRPVIIQCVLAVYSSLSTTCLSGRQRSALCRILHRRPRRRRRQWTARRQSPARRPLWHILLDQQFVSTLLSTRQTSVALHLAPGGSMGFQNVENSSWK